MLIQLRGRQIVTKNESEYHTKQKNHEKFDSILDRVENHIKKELGKEKVWK